MRIARSLFSVIRRHLPALRRSSAPPPERPRPVAPRPECSASHLARTELLGAALDDALGLALRPGEQGPPAKAPRLRGRWKQDTRLLAQICADMVAIDPDLFPGLKVTQEDLFRMVQEITMLENMVGRARQFVKMLERLLAARKDELCTSTQHIVDTVEGLSKAPLLSEEQRGRVKFLAVPIRAHLRERNGRVQQLRQHRRHLREQNEAQVAEAQKELDRVQMENHILRGGSAAGILKR